MTDNMFSGSEHRSPHLAIASRVLALREIEAERKAALDDIREELKEAETELLEEMMQGGIMNFRCDGKTVYTTTRTYVTPKPDCEDRVVRLLYDVERQDIIETKANRPALTNYVKGLIEGTPLTRAQHDLIEACNVSKQTSIAVKTAPKS